MAVTYYAGRIIQGTNAERTGGTWTNLPAGWKFLETDTRKWFYWNASTWAEAGYSSSELTGTLAIGSGGTGQTTATTAFNALSPMTSVGDLIYGGASGTRTRLARGTTRQVLRMKQDASDIAWQDLNDSVDSVDNASISGVLFPGNSSSISYGLWVGMTATGTQSTQIGTGGVSRRQTAAGAAGNNAGWRQPIAISRRAFGAEYYCKFSLSHTSTDIRTYFGYCSSGGAPTGNDYLNALSGIMLYSIDGVTNFRVGKNDGSGATVFVDTGIASDTAVHEFRIKADDTNSRWGWALDSQTLTWETADIPASTTSLDILYEIQAVTATAVTLDNYKNVIRHRHAALV